ncbi:hypothetical protein KIW84_020363 [Lathyrus oleraceus]|uniref:Uncharacterized protein n=1 Tax=Pisum sativum TaxID=3888 RepID=A0A9D4Y553_PEA|nr:hypothetical protein KIW84_020363 [Pisum sativum]
MSSEEEEHYGEEVDHGNQQNNHDYRVKADIPLFYGTMGVEEFLDWKIDVDMLFDVMGVPRTSKHKEKSAATRDSNLENKGTSNPSGAQQGKAPVQRQNNPYTKPTGTKHEKVQEKRRESIWNSRAHDVLISDVIKPQRTRDDGKSGVI